jgi:hypothetical protein
MSIYAVGDTCIVNVEGNIQILADKAKTGVIPIEVVAQIAVAQSNLAIASYLRVLCQILERK